MLAGANSAATEFHRAGSLADWNRVVDDTFGCMSVWSPNHAFSGFLGRCQVDDLQFIRIRAQRSVVHKKIDTRATRASGTLLVHVQAKGVSVNTQGSRRGLLRFGEAVLCDPDRDYSVEFDASYEMFVLRLPTAVVAARHPGLDPSDITARPLNVHHSRLLLAFLCAAWSQQNCLATDPDWVECVNHTILDLLVRSIVRSDSSEATGATREFQSAVLEYVHRNLTDPGMRTSTIADAMGVCSRTVQSVFERMATTSSAFILSERLRIAAAHLRGAHSSVTQVALDAGFNDPAYFTRCFHKHYGVTPRDYSRR